jgi:Tfp pilus assembly protein PilO
MIRNAIAVVLLAAALAIFFFYTDPTYSSVQALSAQGSQYDQALAKATQLQTLKQSLLARYNSFDTNAINRLSTMLPDQVDNIRLILDLDNLASRYGMGLQNVNISTPGTGSGGSGAVTSIAGATEPYDALTIQFTTSGTYEQFSQFLSALQSSLRLVDLLNLSISGGGGVSANAQDPNFTYAMTVQTYWLP